MVGIAPLLRRDYPSQNGGLEFEQIEQTAIIGQPQDAKVTPGEKTTTSSLNANEGPSLITRLSFDLSSHQKTWKASKIFSRRAVVVVTQSFHRKQTHRLPAADLS